jgi:hypothetical protein
MQNVEIPSLHQCSLNRQSTRFKCEGIELSTSTLADQVGYGTAALMPVYDLFEKHVFAAERLHGDDAAIPIQAKDSREESGADHLCLLPCACAAQIL